MLSTAMALFSIFVGLCAYGVGKAVGSIFIRVVGVVAILVGIVSLV
jgi:hypothetical protein